MDQTLHMLEIAYNEDIRRITATPHYHDSVFTCFLEQLNKAFLKLSNKVICKIPNIKLFLDCEIFYNHDIIRLLNEGCIQTMAGSGYVLIEFSTNADYTYLKDGPQKLRFEGYLPILAHAE